MSTLELHMNDALQPKIGNLQMTGALPRANTDGRLHCRGALVAAKRRKRSRAGGVDNKGCGGRNASVRLPTLAGGAGEGA